MEKGFSISSSTLQNRILLPFSPGFAGTLAFGAVKSADIPLGEQPDGIELAKLAATYADGIIMGSADAEEKMGAFVKELSVPVLPFDEASYEDGGYMDQYNSFYDSILK